MCGKIPRKAPLGQTLAHSPVASDLHGPMMICVLVYVLRAPVAYERPARKSLFVLV